MLTDRLDMIIVVDWDVKPQIIRNKNLNLTFFEMTEFSRSARNGLHELTRKTPRKFVFENFCSQSEHEKKSFFLGLICILHLRVPTVSDKVSSLFGSFKCKVIWCKRGLLDFSFLSHFPQVNDPVE